MKPAAHLTGSLLARKGFAAPSQTVPRTFTAPAVSAAPEAETGGGKRVAMTLRLDHQRHLKLRVLAAHINKSSQEVLTLALDEYLDRHTADAGLRHCECLHGKGGCP